MPAVFPFQAIQYQQGKGDVSSLVAPPYDVLDAAAKQRLLDRDRRNIVAIDLPHTPAKELGPPAAYQAAADTYRAWLKEGTLQRRREPAMFAYRQSFRSGDRTFQRCGMAAAVRTVPFGPREGGGILPHEETFSGPKEDRLALMKATRAQLSPIFGLFQDAAGKATRLLHTIMAAGQPSMTADIGDGVRHEVWTVIDPDVISLYQLALQREDIFIADGHHRYNTALNYLRALEAAGPLPEGHPARLTMMVLVGMSDPGLVIWPTHRVLGGMQAYSFDAFRSAAADLLDIRPAGGALDDLEPAMESAAKIGSKNVLGLYDFASRACFIATLKRPDPLKARFPGKPAEWRTLDVALIQHAIVEDICQPRLSAGDPVKWAFPHTIEEVKHIGQGAETGAGGGKGFTPQLALIVRPTPLDSVRAVSRANELMPQKSTFFYPKLATGLWVNPLE
jgi:uncharacterized protein (DUF1015 family)